MLLLNDPSELLMISGGKSAGPLVELGAFGDDVFVSGVLGNLGWPWSLAGIRLDLSGRS